MEVTIPQCLEWFDSIFQMSYEEHSDYYRWVSRGVNINLQKCELEKVITDLKNMNDIDIALYSSHSYEIMLRRDLQAHPRQLRFALNDNEIHDAANKITYFVQPPSGPFMLFMFAKLTQITPLSQSSLGRIDGWILRRMRSESTESDSSPAEISLFEVLKQGNGSYYLTVRIVSETPRSLAEFRRFANSLFFHLSFNLDMPIVPQTSLEHLVRSGSITEVRRRDRDAVLDPPRRYYIDDLIHHYQMAVASNNTPLEYLSYYHIAEHFFETVFDQDMVERVRAAITQPDFSYQRTQDIKKLIKEVIKHQTVKDDRLVFNELEALKLTLEKYVDIVQLGEKLRQYNEGLITYYRDNPVSFCSNGAKIDLESNDIQGILQKLALRIYHTRNAIVHSKENDKKRYVPFKHDKLLEKEIPLLRFIAEQIILGSSEIMS